MPPEGPGQEPEARGPRPGPGALPGARAQINAGRYRPQGYSNKSRMGAAVLVMPP